QFLETQVQGMAVLVSRTGYTGELGYELFVAPGDGAQLWHLLMEAGGPAGLLPLGMRALERARIEAGLLARGSEFDDLISPYQAGIGWAVAMKKPDFIGKAALAEIRRQPPRVAVGLVLAGPEVAAHGQPVFAAGQRWRVGQITSATFSPVLQASIAMAQVVPEYGEPGTAVEVGLLDGFKRRVKATVGPLAAFDPTKSRVRA
ncbi:MAG TPA: glycine cleavage T C-terminal barrel domain-containing protein, partial [Nodosilinea sp.]|nr:glycine cleavage T C-terminal barrel domain-containing protein [Nodosilinea sp.]